MISINTIPVRSEGMRSCGRRKAGGIYLVADAPGSSCGRLPIPLGKCPTCESGFAYARGFNWFDPAPVVEDHPCLIADDPGPDPCRGCPLADPSERSGLIWIGASHYATPADFTEETLRMGISRRIHTVPRGFEVGRTRIYLAHVHAVKRRCPCLDGGSPLPNPNCSKCEGAGREFTPGIFQTFVPLSIEYVLKGTETDLEVASLIERGFQPVRVAGVTTGAGTLDRDATADDHTFVSDATGDCIHCGNSKEDHE